MTASKPQEAATARSAAARPILIGTAIIGGIILAGAGSSAAFGAIASGSATESGKMSVSADGITGLEIEAGGVDLTVEYGPVSKATLATEGGAGNWKLVRDGHDLLVKSPGFALDFCFGWCGDEGRTAVLTLPKELESRALNADVSLGGGRLKMLGDFGTVDLEMGAGDAEVTGAVRHFELDLGAGNFTGDLTDVAEADLQVAAGSATAQLSGTAPNDVTIDVSAGDLELTVPDETYAVQSRVSAGDLTNTLRTDPGSRRTIDVELSAGGVTLRPAN